MHERRAADQSSQLRYLLDSDWVIDALRGVQSATNAINRHQDEGIGVSIIVVGELYDGAVLSLDSEAQFARIRGFVSAFSVLGLTDDIMEEFARNRVRLRVAGQTVPDLDLLIAATALVKDLVLMTRNLRHFERIPGLKIYRGAG